MEYVQKPSPHYSHRRVLFLVLHELSFVRQDCLNILQGKSDLEVSCHYGIDETGQIYQFVPEEKRAWHAGTSYWQGVMDINSTSIGIEIFRENGDDGSYPADQLFNLVTLCQDIIDRHQIRADRIVTHHEIAPGRKSDPGPNFPFKELADQGIGLWPDQAVDILDEDPMDLMVELGYSPVIHHDNDHRNACIAAFQSRYSPKPSPTGVLSESDRLRLSDLINQCRHLRADSHQ